MKSCPACSAEFTGTERFCPFDGTKLKDKELSPPIDPFLGMILQDRYIITSLVGEGPTGRVYQAQHRFLRTGYAVKIFHMETPNKRSKVEAFRRIAAATSTLLPDSTAKLHDFGVLDTGQHYLVMDYLKGQNLDELIRKQGPFAPYKAFEFIIETATIVETIHDQGACHWGIKPTNIYLTTPSGAQQPKVHILDTGVADLVRRDGPLLPRSPGDALWVTPSYLAPEQILGKQPDSRSDLYALGTILYQCLTGEPPFQAETHTECLKQVLHRNPKPPRIGLGGKILPEEVTEVTLRLLARNPEDRYDGLAEASMALKLAAETLLSPGTTETQHEDDRDTILDLSSISHFGGAASQQSASSARFDSNVAFPIEQRTATPAVKRTPQDHGKNVDDRILHEVTEANAQAPTNTKTPQSEPNDPMDDQPPWENEQHDTNPQAVIPGDLDQEDPSPSDTCQADSADTSLVSPPLSRKMEGPDSGNDSSQEEAIEPIEDKAPSLAKHAPHAPKEIRQPSETVDSEWGLIEHQVRKGKPEGQTNKPWSLPSLKPWSLGTAPWPDPHSTHPPPTGTTHEPSSKKADLPQEAILKKRSVAPQKTELEITLKEQKVTEPSLADVEAPIPHIGHKGGGPPVDNLSLPSKHVETHAKNKAEAEDKEIKREPSIEEMDIVPSPGNKSAIGPGKNRSKSQDKAEKKATQKAKRNKTKEQERPHKPSSKSSYDALSVSQAAADDKRADTSRPGAAWSEEHHPEQSPPNPKEAVLATGEHEAWFYQPLESLDGAEYGSSPADERMHLSVYLAVGIVVILASVFIVLLTLSGKEDSAPSSRPKRSRPAAMQAETAPIIVEPDMAAVSPPQEPDQAASDDQETFEAPVFQGEPHPEGDEPAAGREDHPQPVSPSVSSEKVALAPTSELSEPQPSPPPVDSAGKESAAPKTDQAERETPKQPQTAPRPRPPKTPPREQPRDIKVAELQQDETAKEAKEPSSRPLPKMEAGPKPEPVAKSEPEPATKPEQPTEQAAEKSTPSIIIDRAAPEQPASQPPKPSVESDKSAIPKDSPPQEVAPAQKAQSLMAEGQTHARNHRLAEASQAFRQALALDAKNHGAYAGLGDVAFQENRFADAVNHHRRAVQLAPNVGRYQNKLGTSYYRLRDYQLAARHWRRAVELDPNDASARAFLKMVERQISEDTLK